jgi:hypothetical protein
MEHIYGLNAHPDDAPGWWGARAILAPRAFRPMDILPDRQSSGGERFPLLMRLLNEYGGLSIAQARASALCNNFKLVGKEQFERILLDTDLVKVVADTRASHGYVYISAWLKAETLDVSEAKWTGAQPPPAPGTTISTSVWGSPVEVLTSMNLNGHHFLAFSTGRPVKSHELEELREWRLPLANAKAGRSRTPSALVNLHYPALAIGLTVGHEVQGGEG